MDSARTHAVLKELIALDVVERVTRFGDKSGARFARYRPTDPFTSFWYRHIASGRSRLVSTPPDVFWDTRIGPRLNDHMGHAFEVAVRDAVRSGRFSETVGEINVVQPWWNRDHSTEIDWIVETDRGLWCVEAKWRGQGTVDIPDLKRLRGHVSRCTALKGRDVRLLMATAGEFTPRLRAVAAAEEILLLGPNDLV